MNVEHAEYLLAEHYLMTERKAASERFNTAGQNLELTVARMMKEAAEAKIVRLK